MASLNGGLGAEPPAGSRSRDRSPGDKSRAPGEGSEEFFQLFCPFSYK